MKGNLFIILFLMHFSGVAIGMSLENLRVPQEVGTEIQPLTPDPLLPRSAAHIQGKTKVKTFMAVTCYDRYGKIHQPGGNEYSDCLETSNYNQRNSIFNHSGNKVLQMGLVLQK